MQFSNRKLLNNPVVIVIHIALVVGIFKLIFPEVNPAGLSTVIAGIGLCWALLTDYLFTKFTKKKNKEEGNEKTDSEK